MNMKNIAGGLLAYSVLEAACPFHRKDDLHGENLTPKAHEVRAVAETQVTTPFHRYDVADKGVSRVFGADESPAKHEQPIVAHVQTV